MPDTPLDSFLSLVQGSFHAGTLVRLVLSKPRASRVTPRVTTQVHSDIIRVTARPLVLKDQPVLSFVQTHKTRDITRNLPFDPAALALRSWLSDTFSHAHLFTATEEIQLMISKKGKETLIRGAHKQAPPTETALDGHDRAKHRYVDLDRPFLTALGVTDAQHRLVPAMSRKWKQINKFVEVLDHALAATNLKSAARVDVLDFGSGKGYLTFATHDHLRHTLGLPARVTGVDLKADMVALCNDTARQVGAEGLHFDLGDVRSHAPQPTDIMIALHACDTATDHAIHTGLRAGASIIMCSPCCHKELRPQLLSPHPLRPILKHGVHLGQEAEMLTDGLRAMLLDACGYDTQVFEFISLEHTSKNKMILAVKRTGRTPSDEVWQQIQDIKGFYGIREQCLETLLKADRAVQGAAA